MYVAKKLFGPYLPHSRGRYRQFAPMTLISCVIIMLSLSYFTILSTRHISLPGLYYDEVLFVNAATGGRSSSFVAMRIFGIPVMLMSYIGALKAYIYFPIFKIFGISPLTIRLPAIFISLISLLMVFTIARICFNNLASAILVSFVAVDPIFIFMTKLDFGPIVLAMLLKLLVLFFFLKMITTLSTRYLWPLTISCILGLYDKLNFIWFVIALASAAIILFRTELSELRKRHPFSFLVPLVSLLIVATVSSLLLILPLMMQTQRSDVTLWDRFLYALKLYGITMNGSELYTRVLDSQLPLGTAANYATVAALVITLIAGVRILVQKRRRQPVRLSFFERAMACYLILFALIFVQIVLTHKAGGAHHILMLYPFHHFLAVGAAVGLLHALNERFGPAGSPPSWAVSRPVGASRKHSWRTYSSKVGSGILLASGVLLLASEVNVGLSYDEAFNEKQAFNPRWSPVIYELAAYVNDRDIDVIVFPDWGIHNQVFALGAAETRAKCLDLWLVFREMDDPQRGVEVYNKFFKGRRALAVLFSQDAEVMPNARRNFFAFADYFSGKRDLERVFSSARGKPTFEVYYVDWRADDSTARHD
jgi:hypothetical protein